MDGKDIDPPGHVRFRRMRSGFPDSHKRGCSISTVLHKLSPDSVKIVYNMRQAVENSSGVRSDRRRLYGLPVAHPRPEPAALAFGILPRANNYRIAQILAAHFTSQMGDQSVRANRL